MSAAERSESGAKRRVLGSRGKGRWACRAEISSFFLNAVFCFSFLFFCRGMIGSPPLVERRSVDLA
jgi:hypothetical protein